MVQLICTEGSQDGSDSFCPICQSFLCADKDIGASLPLPLTSCRISSELECPSHRRVLGLASGRSRIVLSLCFPFTLLGLEVVSQLVCRTERISLMLTVAVLQFPLSEIPLKEAEDFSNVFLISLFQIHCCCCQFKDSSEQTGTCSGTLACSAASNAWQLSSQAAYSCLYSYEAREMQLGKSYL